MNGRSRTPSSRRRRNGSSPCRSGSLDWKRRSRAIVRPVNHKMMQHTRTTQTTSRQSTMTLEVSMRSFYTCIISALSLLFCAGLQAQTLPDNSKSALVPRLIRFAGSYKVPGSQPHSGVMGARFAIYREEIGGTPLWSEAQNLEVDATGNYVAMLGSASNNGVPAELFVSGESRWLEVEFSTPGGIPQPRTLLASVPYALKAADADTL